MNPEAIPVILVLIVLPVICVLTVIVQGKRNIRKQEEINKLVDELHK